MSRCASGDGYRVGFVDEVFMVCVINGVAIASKVLTGLSVDIAYTYEFCCCYFVKLLCMKTAQITSANDRCA